MAVVAITAAATGCADESCTLQGGTYRMTIVETSGSCGELSTITRVVDPELGPPFAGGSSECTGPVDFTPGLCDVDFDRTCPARNQDGAQIGTLRFRGASAVVAADRIEGSFTLRDDTPGFDCYSSYDVVWDRL